MNKAVLAAGLVVTTPLLALLVANRERDPSHIASPLIGKSAPDVVLRSMDDGTALRLSSLRGKSVVMNFWASWCRPCVQEHEALGRAARAHAEIAFLGVVYDDSEENARNFLAKRGRAYAPYLDQEGKAAIAFGIYGVPETYFINARGEVVSKFVGPLDEQTIETRIEEMRR